MKKNIGVNAVLNVIKYSLAVLFPLITYPYALRVLGAEGIGKVSYSNSILTYFSMLAMLGGSTYGIREGAKRKNNKTEFNRFANELFTINMISTFVAYVLLLITVFWVKRFHDYAALIALQSVSIILTTLGIDWINTVYEDFLFITVRSVVAHLISLALLFILVHSPEDYYYYALLSISTNGLTCITNWFYCRKYVKIRLTKSPNFKLHLKPLLILFANALTISVYVNFDTTMLGWMKGDYAVGVYTVAVKVYSIVKNIMIAIYAVGIPRLAMYIGNHQISEYKKLYSDLWSYVSLILTPAGVGLICIADEIMVIMGGKQFFGNGLSLQILAIALIFSIFGGLTTAVLNVTLGREKENMIATFISAGLNFGLNLIFIPKFSLYGAAFTTMVSEFFVFVYCFVRVPNKKVYIDFMKVRSSISHALVGSVMMIIATVLLKKVLPTGITGLFVIVPVCGVIYASCLFVLRDYYFMENLNKIRLKIRRE